MSKIQIYVLLFLCVYYCTNFIINNNNKMTLSLCRYDKSIMNNTVQCLQASAEDRKWRCRCDVTCCGRQLRQLTAKLGVQAPEPKNIYSTLRFNGHFSVWTWVSRYQNVSILDFIGAKGDGGQFLQARCPSCHPTNSVRAPKEHGEPKNINVLFLNAGTWLPPSLMVYASVQYFPHCWTRMKRQWKKCSEET